MEGQDDCIDFWENPRDAPKARSADLDVGYRDLHHRPVAMAAYFSGGFTGFEVGCSESRR